MTSTQSPLPAQQFAAAQDPSAGQHPALQDAAAEALSAALPVSLPVSARRFPDALGNAAAGSGSTGRPEATTLTDAGDLAVVSFVGGLSAEAAVHVDPDVLGDAAALDPALVSLDDVLRPAFEAATGVLGTGVLSTAPTSAAEPLLRDPQTGLFQLVAADRVIGWFALRLRAAGPGGHGTDQVRPAGLGSAAPLDPSRRPGHGPGATTPRQHSEEEVTSRLSRLNNVQMALTVEIGRTRVSVREVLGLEPGAVIELDRNAGAPADVRLNGRLIAQGEVVVMDQDYGVRITRILDSAEGLT